MLKYWFDFKYSTFSIWIFYREKRNQFLNTLAMFRNLNLRMRKLIDFVQSSHFIKPISNIHQALHNKCTFVDDNHISLYLLIWQLLNMYLLFKMIYKSITHLHVTAKYARFQSFNEYMKIKMLNKCDERMNE